MSAAAALLRRRLAARWRRVCNGAVICGCVLQAGAAAAFPLSDSMGGTLVPNGTELAAPDVRDLNHQMQLLSGFGSVGTGWTILPRVTAQEEFTDNVLQLSAPRRWDLVTIVAPGIAVAGDTGRVQLRLDYEPQLEMHVTTGSQNVLAQQLNTTGTVTIVRDLLFVDVRGLAGVQATNGGIGGIGGLGQSTFGPVTATSALQNNSLGLSKENRTQTASFSISPYVLYHFGDTGDGRLGATLGRASSSQVNGFAPIPLLSTGINGQVENSLEEFAQFQTGQRFAALRYTFTGNGQQSVSSASGEAVASSYRTSSRYTADNRVDYQINRGISIYGQAGWEKIDYSGNNALNIGGLTWGFGTTLTPNPDTQVTLGYGHQNGTNSLTFNAHYALTPRTILTGSYDSGVGTQLEQIQNQLDQSTVGNNGNLVNHTTGGQEFAGNNALGVAAGIFRYSTLTLGSTTTLDRDTVTFALSYSQETRVGAGAPGTATDDMVGSVSYSRQFNPKLLGSAFASYSVGTQTANASTQSLAAGLNLQYILSETVSTFARYSYLSRAGSTPGLAMYQDLVIVGITKQF